MTPRLWWESFLAWWRRVTWEQTGGSAARRRLRAHLRAWDTAVRSLGTDLISMRAHALTFRTLLSLVPLLAVVFSLFKGFGGLEAAELALRQQVLANLAPGAAADAVQYMRGFVDRVSAGAVGGVGVVILFVTVITLLGEIERSFNALWRVDRGRPFLGRFVTYWAMITVGPVLLALSLTMTSAVQSHALVAALEQQVPGSTLGFRLVPWALSCLALTLLYQIVPNTSVGWRSAVGGGITAGTLWELGKLTFAWASSNLLRYDAIYGSFSVLPVFLLWLQIGWMIVLLGCKVAFGLQHAGVVRRECVRADVGTAAREVLALRCVMEAARAHEAGLPPPDASAIAAAAGSNIETAEVLRDLVSAGLLFVVVPPMGDSSNADEPAEGYVPARDASRITVRQVLDVVRRPGVPAPLRDEADRTGRFLRDLLDRLDDAATPLLDMRMTDALQAIEEAEQQEEALAR